MKLPRSVPLSAALLLSLLSAAPAYSAELVRLVSASRYSFYVVNASPYRLEATLHGRTIILEPNQRLEQRRSQARRSEPITLRYTEEAWASRRAHELEERAELLQELMAVEAAQAAWSTPEAARLRLEKAEEGFRQEIRAIQDISDFASGMFGQEEVYLVADDEVFVAWRENFMANGIIDLLTMAAVEYTRQKYQATLRSPDFDGQRAALTRKIEATDLRVAENDAVFAASQGEQNDWTEAFDAIAMDRIRYPKADVTPYASVDLGFSVIKPELGNDWERRGTMSMHAEAALPLMPEIALHRGDVSWYLRLMGTAGFERIGGGLDDDNPYQAGAVPVGPGGGSASIVYEVIPVGGQLRVSFLPWGFVDLGAGYQMYTGSAVRASIGEDEAANTFSERGVVTFDRSPSAQNVYGQARVAVLLGGGHNERHAGGMFLALSSKLYQLPEVTATPRYDVQQADGPSAGLPEAGRWMGDLRFSVGLAF